MKLPTWLRCSALLSEKRKKELAEYSRSWVTLAPALKSLSKIDCLYIIELELTTREKPRPEMISRPFHRAMREMRLDRWKELQDMTPGIGYRFGDNGEKQRA